MGRVKRKVQKRSVSQQNAVSAPAPATDLPAGAVSSRRSASAEFNPDYSYVIKDLKMIAVLAVSFTTLLVVLSFFLR